MSRSGPTCGALMLAALAGCADTEQPVATFSVVDSAGVEIVHSQEPAWDEGSAWSVSSTPALEIGDVEGEEPYLLDQVMGVARLPDDRVAVAMMGDNTVRFYDSDGRYLDRFGGTGDGPREFRQIMQLARRADRLYVVQFGLQPIKVLDVDTGELVRNLNPPQVDLFPGPRAIFADESMVYAYYPQGQPLQAGVYVGSGAIARVTQEAGVDTIGVFPMVSFIAVDNRFPIAQEYGPTLQVHVSGQYLYLGYNADYDIGVWSPEGELLRRLGRRWEPIPVTGEDRERHRDGQLGMGAEGGGEVPPRLRQQRQTMIDATIYPTHHVAHEWMREDRAGNLWVRRTKPDRNRWQMTFTAVDETPTGWDVFDSRGVWLGVVEMPARFRVMEIGPDYVAGVWKDELDVELVRIYALSKPTGEEDRL